MKSIRYCAGLFAATCATIAGAHPSFAPHFDIKKPVSISGKIRTQEYVCESHGFTQLKLEPFNCSPEGVDGTIRKQESL